MVRRLYFLCTILKDRGSYVIYNVSIFSMNSVLKELISCVDMASDALSSFYKYSLGNF